MRSTARVQAHCAPWPLPSKSLDARNTCVTLSPMSEQPIIYSDLREALRRSGLTRAALARRAGMQPAGIRRIFGKNNNHNPTLSTLSAMADALGYEVRFQAKSARDAANAKPSMATTHCQPATTLHACQDKDSKRCWQTHPGAS